MTSTLLGMDREEISALVGEADEPSYRGKQISEAVYRQRVESLAEISTLPLGFREWLQQRGVTIGAPRIENKFVSTDGTVRYLIAFADGESVETVWMPEGDGGEAGDGSEAGAEVDQAVGAGRAFGRSTICISSQVGCAVDCQFCLTALLGVKRNLTPGEIVGQVGAVLKDQKISPPEDRINLVFMGMGEPFLNYENFMKASRLLVECVGIAERRMTVSTAGIVPRIHDFGNEGIRPKLAISLNASNDELRTRLMPLNRKWNLEMLIGAAREFPLRTREWITFEYVLLGGVNDEPENAKEVAELLRGVRCKVNLIALNPGPGIEFTTPGAERVA
ncbi:MAG: 23S rRNA (adenine(2503)-C(2))-methyltransferase RlmN, partial [Candidatus Sulfotelmatobacter sp.]